MKPTTVNNKIVTTMLLAAACGIALAALARKINLAESASAAVNPKVIAITAKRFEFTPNEITLKKGETVVLRLTTADRVHGFFSRALKVDTDIPPGKTTEVAVTPDTAGVFPIICDHYCGTGHGNMKMKVVVVE
jgi:cytochrome c oxidase subunit 2